MSYVFDVQNTENQAGRRGKAMATRSTAQGAPKRAALGVITNQVNQVRVQPSRAAKPKVKFSPLFLLEWGRDYSAVLLARQNTLPLQNEHDETVGKCLCFGLVFSHLAAVAHQGSKLTEASSKFVT